MPMARSGHIETLWSLGITEKPNHRIDEALILPNCRVTRRVNHCVAFAKTPKRIRNGILSVYFEIGLKLSSFKKLQKFDFCPTSLSAWAVNCQESNPGLRRNFQPPWPISQTLRWTNAVFTCIWNHSVLQNGELSFPNGQNSISWYFFSQTSKFCFSILMYSSVQSLVI